MIVVHDTSGSLGNLVILRPEIAARHSEISTGAGIVKYFGDNRVLVSFELTPGQPVHQDLVIGALNLALHEEEMKQEIRDKWEEITEGHA